MVDSWRTLKIGDKVRVVAWPEEIHGLHSETREFYEWLIETKSVLTITEIDAWGLPYGHISRIVDGVERSEYLALNHSGLEIVSPEGKEDGAEGMSECDQPDC